jgi:hypothetical protein
MVSNLQTIMPESSDPIQATGNHVGEVSKLKVGLTGWSESGASLKLPVGA